MSPPPASAGQGGVRRVKAPAIRYLVKFHSRLFCRRAGGGCWRGGGGVCACVFVSSNQISFVLQIASIASLRRGQRGSAENN